MRRVLLLLAIVSALAATVSSCDDDDYIPYVKTWSANADDVIYLSYPGIDKLVDRERNRTYCPENRDTFYIERIDSDCIALHIPSPNDAIRGDLIYETDTAFYYGRTYESSFFLGEQRFAVKTSFYSSLCKLPGWLLTYSWVIYDAKIDGLPVPEEYHPQKGWLAHGAYLRKNAKGQLEVDTTRVMVGLEDTDEAEE